MLRSMTESAHGECPYFLHTSIRLYAMVFKPFDVPTVEPGATYSGDMQMLCHRAQGKQIICTYLSPLDAVMGSRGLVDGAHFWPIDFRSVDTRHYLENHDGNLTVSIHYAYAADHGRLVVDKHGHPMMVYTESSFTIPRDQWDHLSIGFDEHATGQMSDVFVRAGLPCFGETLNEMASWSAEQIADAEEQAIARRPSTVCIDDLNEALMSQCTIYDPESGDWLFAEFD